MDLNNYLLKVLENLKADNNMPFVKTEVVYDTLLYPEVLVKLLEQQGIKAQYVTKEFPIDKRKYLGIEEDGYVSVDYLLVEDSNSENKNREHSCKKLYLVELKTTNASFDYEQLERYSVAMKNFPKILAGYLNSDYANNKAYDVQREAVRKALKDEQYEAVLVYIIPGFKKAKDVIDRVDKAVERNTKNVERYKALQQNIQGQEIITISLNNLVSKKKDKAGKLVFDENSSLDQFLYIWNETTHK